MANRKSNYKTVIVATATLLACCGRDGVAAINTNNVEKQKDINFLSLASAINSNLGLMAFNKKDNVKQGQEEDQLVQLEGNSVPALSGLIDNVIKKQLVKGAKEMVKKDAAVEQGKQVMEALASVKKDQMDKSVNDAISKDPELQKKQKLLAEIEKKNEQDSKKGLWQPKVEPQKNQTLLALVKNIASKHKNDEKPALVEQGRLSQEEQQKLLQLKEAEKQAELANFMSIKIPKKQVSMQELMMNSKNLLAEATDLQKVKAKKGTLSQKEKSSVADREARMQDTLKFLKQQEKIKQQQESNDFGAELLAKTNDMLQAVNALNEDATKKMIAQEAEKKANTMTVEVPVQPSIVNLEAKQSSVSQTQSKLASSTSAQEISDLITAEVNAKQAPKPAAKGSDLKSEVADLISKSLAQNTMNKKVEKSGALIQQATKPATDVAAPKEQAAPQKTTIQVSVPSKPSALLVDSALPKTIFSFNSFGLSNMNPFNSDSISGQIVQEHSEIMEMKDKIEGLSSIGQSAASPGTSGMASDLADDNEFLMTKEHHNDPVEVPKMVSKK